MQNSVQDFGSASGRPDIVLFMTDQQRYDQLGFASGGFFETPALDGLASRGVRFDCAYSASTTCMPARNALLTGIQPHRLAVGTSPPVLPPDTWTVAQALREAGYETALFGKMHFIPIHASHGFETLRTAEHLTVTRHAIRTDGTPDVDDYHQWLVELGLGTWDRLEVGEPPVMRPAPPPADETAGSFPYDRRYHATTWIEQQVTTFLDQRRSGRPLFLVVSFPHPHTPLNPPDPYRSRYDPADVVVPKPGFEANDHLPAAFRAALLFGGRVYKPWQVEVHGEVALKERQTRIRALVAQIDESIGRLLPRFDLDRTLVTFTSDHGDYGGRRGLAGKTPCIPFDDLARVPLVIAGAGVTGGRRVGDIVQSSDLALTYCDIAGVDVPVDEFDSRSLRPLLTGCDDGTERAAIIATNRGWPAVRRGALKLILHVPEFSFVLFDLERDPDESNNIAGDAAYAEGEAELGELLRATFARAKPNLPRFAPAAGPR
jgi:choline-sulfatase